MSSNSKCGHLYPISAWPGVEVEDAGLLPRMVARDFWKVSMKCESVKVGKTIKVSASYNRSVATM